MSTAVSTGNIFSQSRKATDARRRRSDPLKWAEELARDRARYHAGSKRVRKARYERIKAALSSLEFRALCLRRNYCDPTITGEWLQSLWDKQEGRCALTGRPLEWPFCEVDHIVPRSRGGSNDRSNLRLLCSEANAAKHSLLDKELIALCRDIVEKLGG